MKSITALFIFTSVSIIANAQKFDKLIGESKSEVQAAIILEDNIVDIGTGETNSGQFYFSVNFEDDTYAGIYFENNLCEIVTHFVSFKDYKAKFKKFKNLVKTDTNIEELSATAFHNKKTNIITEFTVETNDEYKTVYRMSYFSYWL